MSEAVRLVKEDKMSMKKAALFINEIKKNAVPRITLMDRVKRDSTPVVGRPLELKPEVEAALVKSLKMCAEFNYPMKKRDLQNLVQSY